MAEGMEAADPTVAVVDSTAVVEAAGSTRVVGAFMGEAPAAGTLVEAARTEVEACPAPEPTVGLHSAVRHLAALAGTGRAARERVRLRPRTCASVQALAAEVSAAQAGRLGLTMRLRMASGIPLGERAIQRLPELHRDLVTPVKRMANGTRLRPRAERIERGFRIRGLGETDLARRSAIADSVVSGDAHSAGDAGAVASAGGSVGA